MQKIKNGQNNKMRMWDRKLDGLLCENPVNRLQKSRASVLGREINTGNLFIAYHDLSENSDKRIISEDSFRETYFVNPLLYLTQRGRELIPNARENITKTRHYYFMLDKIYKTNTANLSEAQKKEIIKFKERLGIAYALQESLPIIND